MGRWQCWQPLAVRCSRKVVVGARAPRTARPAHARLHRFPAGPDVIGRMLGYGSRSLAQPRLSPAGRPLVVEDDGLAWGRHADGAALSFGAQSAGAWSPSKRCRCRDAQRCIAAPTPTRPNGPRPPAAPCPPPCRPVLVVRCKDVAGKAGTWRTGRTSPSVRRPCPAAVPCGRGTKSDVARRYLRLQQATSLRPCGANCTAIFRGRGRSEVAAPVLAGLATTRNACPSVRSRCAGSMFPLSLLFYFFPSNVKTRPKDTWMASV